MCYGCTPTCDNCRPKMVRCDACGRTNFLTRDRCFFCEEAITQDMKDRAIADWKAGVRLAGPPAPSRGAAKRAAESSEVGRIDGLTT